MSSSIYNSKILLFGEYSIILNSFGFAIPYPLYNGYGIANPNEFSIILYSPNSKILELYIELLILI